MQDNQVPFSEDYVLKITFQNMVKAVNRSIDKTHSRLEDRPDQAMKILECISNLVRIRKVVEEMEAQNQHLLGDK